MTQLTLRRFLPILLLALSATVACGGDGSSGDGDGGDGGDGDGGDGDGTKNTDETISDLWADYCSATFTEDYSVTDAFDDVAFTARAGETYLVSSFTSFFGDEATLFFLTKDGPESFEVAQADGGFPFTSNCDVEATTAYYAVFTDVTVYATESLEEVLCELPAGHVVPSNGSSGSATYDLNFSGPTTYEIILGGLSSECGDAERGYVSVPQTQVWGTTTWLVPIRPIVGPAK